MKCIQLDEIHEKAGHFKPVLQYRWQLVQTNSSHYLQYFGIRNYPDIHERSVDVSKELVTVITQMNGEKTLKSIIADLSTKENSKKISDELNTLFRKNIIVDKVDCRKPRLNMSSQQCVKCVNNDYILPGLEFDERGHCAYCQAIQNPEDNTATFFIGGDTITENELLRIAEANPSRFDVMALYTGGKDSSFLLWYLSVKLKLRVLACNWNTPFTNVAAYQNIRTAQKKLPNVEFVERTVSWEPMKGAMKTLIKNYGLPCMCPTLPYALFYPMAVQERIPLIMDGIESSQTNLARLSVTSDLKPNIEKKSDRDSTRSFLKRIAMPQDDDATYADKVFKTLNNALPEIFLPVVQLLNNTDSHFWPKIKRLESSKLYDRWADVGKLLAEEIGWKMPEGQEGMLHTSCDIEKVKDFIQLRAFGNMNNDFYPQSVLEISSAIHFGHITRDEGLKELEERGYYGIPKEVNHMLHILEFSNKDIDEMKPHIKELYRGIEL